MEVWVRSQDREVFSVVRDIRFTTMKKHKLAENTGTINTFVAVDDAYCIECNREFFGEYPTKERCLEIIDEIQELLCQTVMVVRNLGGKPTLDIEQHEQSVVVYEMPKE